MNTVYHIPAMLEPTVQGLITDKNGIYVDVTFGGGGHSRRILQELTKDGHLYGFDQDIDTLANCPKDERFTYVRSNFRYLSNWMDYYGVEAVDGILADLGVSFHHFDEAERGFSFRFPGPLDMRMNQKATKTAADIINNYDEADLARTLYINGELKESRQLAHKIVSKRPINTIDELILALGYKINENRDFEPRAKHTLTCVFQALRMEVNDELGALKEMLEAAKEVLKPGGRIAILTYHSLEDRIVKNFLKSGNIEGKIEKDFYGNSQTPFVVLEKGRMADEAEVAQNPRARSAKLRIGEKQ